VSGEQAGAPYAILYGVDVACVSECGPPGRRGKKKPFSRGRNVVIVGTFFDSKRKKLGKA
jgi:hypothetical protein